MSKLPFAGLVAAVALLIAPLAAAQSTRTVVVSWAASPSGTVVGYIVQVSTTAAAGPFVQVACTGTVGAANYYSGPTCVAGSTSSTLVYQDLESVGGTVYYQVVAVAPLCTPTTPATSPCGNSGTSVTAATTVPPRPTVVGTLATSTP